MHYVFLTFTEYRGFALTSTRTIYLPALSGFSTINTKKRTRLDRTSVSSTTGRHIPTILAVLDITPALSHEQRSTARP